MAPTRREVANLNINTLKKAKYESLTRQGLISEDELYATTDGNEKTEYGDLYGDIENQADLDNALYASRIQLKNMSNDPRGYATILALKESGTEITDNYPLQNITIPCIESRDGVKIVDIQYKDRVDLLYELTGQGNYIIIDEENTEFRLPLPDLYSLIEKNTATFTIREWED